MASLSLHRLHELLHRMRARSRAAALPAMSETQRFLLISMLIGIFAGMLVVCFHIAIDNVSWWVLGTPAGTGALPVVLAPVLGALASSQLVKRVFPAARGSGVNSTKAALYIYDGHVPLGTVAGKFAACSISIGSGNPLGPEDPALQMGAGVASLLGRTFKLSRDVMRMIAPVGAAAGIAAAFNTPITAVLFVIEEVLAGWNAGVLGSIVLAAVSAVVVNRTFLGDQPLFRVPGFELTHSSELLIYAMIGLAGGLLSVAFVKAIAWLRPRLEGVPPRWKWAMPAAAALVVGLLGLAFPEILGAGYESVDSALHDQFPWHRLLTLALLKLCVVALCFTAGVPGGMFAPTLFIGAMAGGGLGALAHQYWPMPTSTASAYVLVGMGTFFAGVFRAPMTSIFMVFEVSASYVIILPVMIANTISYLVSRQLQPTPFFTLVARQEGMNLPAVEQQRESRLMRVEDIMRRPPILVLRADRRVSRALEQLRDSGAAHALVWKDRATWSYAARDGLEGAAAGGMAERPLSEALPLPDLPPVYRDLSLDAALRLLARHPLLAVCSRADHNEILGSLALDDVHRAYGIAARTPPDQRD